MSRRTERVGSTLQQELASIMMREISDPRLVGLPSITRVRVSEDMSVADVYVTIMGSPGQQTAALNALKHSAGMMRTRLTQVLSMRIAPFLKFHIDENVKKEIEMQAILQKVADENAEADRRRAGLTGDADATDDVDATDDADGTNDDDIDDDSDSNESEPAPDKTPR